MAVIQGLNPEAGKTFKGVADKFPNGVMTKNILLLMSLTIMIIRTKPRKVHCEVMERLIKLKAVG